MPTPGWSYAVEYPDGSIIVIGDIGPEYTPYAGPPEGIDMPSVEMAEHLTWPAGSVVSSSMLRPRTLAFTVGVKAATLPGLTANRRELYRIVRSDGEKTLFVGPYYAPPSDVKVEMWGARYRLVGMETRMTGPLSCDVTFRVLMESPFLERYMSSVALSGVTATQGISLYDVASPVSAPPVDYHIMTGATDWRSVVPYNNEFWCLRSTGEVMRYSTSGALVGTSTVTPGNILELFAGTIIAASPQQLYRWTGSSWAAWGPMMSGGSCRFIQVSADGGRLIVVGTFTSPRKGYMCLDAAGAVVTSEIFPAATTIELSSAYDVDGMCLYAGQVGSDIGMWAGQYNAASPIRIATMDHHFSRINRAASWASVYVCTHATTCNGGPTGGLLRVQGGSAIRTIAEGITFKPRMFRRFDGDEYITASIVTGPTHIARIRPNGGIVPVCNADNYICDIAFIGDRMCVVGGMTQISRQLYLPITIPGDGVALRVSPANKAPLVVYQHWRDRVWGYDVQQNDEGMCTLSAESHNHASGTDWGMELQPVGPSGLRIMGRYGTPGVAATAHALTQTL